MMGYKVENAVISRVAPSGPLTECFNMTNSCLPNIWEQSYNMIKLRRLRHLFAEGTCFQGTEKAHWKLF